MKETRDYRRKEKQGLRGISEIRNRPRTISHLHELLPGLNDISDAFEALPLDIVKYFTLLKEIDAKCINTVPQINNRIKTYIDNLHVSTNEQDKVRAFQEKQKRENSQLDVIKDKINEIIPCLEEKMHVTSVATDLLNKHMRRINQDYKLIIQNNEIPENIRIGPLVHPAMILDSSHPSRDVNANGEGVIGGGSGGGGGAYGNSATTAQSQRSESRREALAARKSNKDDDRDVGSGSNANKKKRSKEQTPLEGGKGNNGGNGNSGYNDNAKKRKNEDRSSSSSLKKKKKGLEDIEDVEDGDEVDGNTTGKKSNSTNLDRLKASAASGGGSSSSGSHEPTYCYCNQVSFGEMVGCDGDDCKREWFHLPCIGFKNPPKGKWYCDDCLKKMKVKKV